MEQQEYAGFWIRLGASLIDSVLLLVALAIPLTWIYGTQYWVDPELQSGLWHILLNYVLPIAVTVWFWVKYLGTPGKLLLGLHVVDARTGRALSTPQAIGRYLAYYVSALPLLLGFIWVAFDPKKQGFHDKLAGTVVIRQRDRTPPVHFERDA